jgi:hypothetical protein
MNDAQQIAVGAVTGLLSSSVFVLALFIGFCLLFGLTKLIKTTGRGAVVKSLDETITHQQMVYLKPGAPRGPADQLRSPELLEAAARK